MYAWIGCGIPGHCQVFNKPEAMGKVIDAATMLGRTTGLSILYSVAHSISQATHQPIFPRTPYIMLATLFVSINRKHKMKIPALLCVMIWVILPVFHLRIFFTACDTLGTLFCRSGDS